jgi:F-type H+-transporting ATPase subunit a
LIKKGIKISFFFLALLLVFSKLYAFQHKAEQSHEEDHSQEQQHMDDSHGDHHAVFDPANTAFHHLSDQNIYSIGGPLNFPLPCILYAPEEGWSTFMSSKFDFDSHGEGSKAYKGYVLHEGVVQKVKDASFPKESIAIGGFGHKTITLEDGTEKDISTVKFHGKEYDLDKYSTADGGVFGGGITSFYDFSPSKNVIAMIIVSLLLAWMFLSIARSYKKRKGMPPKGLQSFIEPIWLFMQDEVIKPFVGPKWLKFTPFLMSLFFFILGLNLFGQIPFFGGANVTGNLAVTMVLAIFAFVVTTINGKKTYWEHVFWMPGVPTPLRILIMTPVEFIGLFIKPTTLMLRLFANITAGHMVVVIFVGLIFMFGNMGTSPGAAYGTAVGSVLLTMFMMAIELLVAFIQAFVFTILTASYIGAAIEEHH